MLAERLEFMKILPMKKPRTRIAVLESDPLRLVGFRALFDSEPEMELVSCALADLPANPEIPVALLGSRNGDNLFDMIAGLKAARPDLRVIVTGSVLDEETVLK